MSSPRNSAKTPQAGINDFWSKFATSKPSKVTSIFPRLLYANMLPEHPDPRGVASARNAADSYEAAANECREKVAKIVQECYRTNEKFTDPDFDIESDLYVRQNCLYGLKGEYSEKKNKEREKNLGKECIEKKKRKEKKCSGRILRRIMYSAGDDKDEKPVPSCVHRVDWIFPDPKFTIVGFSPSDIIQERGGDCWWLAAVATLAHRQDLMNKVCVVQNEECGVYGFVFHRDGEWVSTIIDDNLYLEFADFSEAEPETYDPTGEKAQKYRAQKQTGSQALWFGRCADPNETWLPLLEKAYAKAHGDYEAIRGGWSNEAAEDMTGGVSNTITTTRVLSKDKLWKELASDDGDFVFALETSLMRLVPVQGISMGHSYSMLHATEEVDEDGNKLRFVKIRNPWGEKSSDGSQGEWKGRWSDGSREWTPYWMEKLKHTFRNDGVFWMLYEDVLEHFECIHRTRLFDEKWTVVQQWTSCNVAWLTGYSRTKFVVDVKKSGTVILVLAQLDDRYFKKLQGQYRFELHFLLKRIDAPATDYICRVRAAGHGYGKREVSAEVLLDPGIYEVMPKVIALRDESVPTLEYIIKHSAPQNPQKLHQVGMQYDLAHAKGGITDEDQKLMQNRPGKANNKPKTPANANTHLQNQSDVPKIMLTDLKNLSEEWEGEQVEDAAGDIDGHNAQTTNGLNHDGTSMRKLPIRSKAKPALWGFHEEKDDIRPNPGIPKSDADEASDASSADIEGDEEEEDNDDSCWNAVCVICLRVYSQDPDLTISLVQPETIGGEPSSSLVQGQEPAGATQ